MKLLFATTRTGRVCWHWQGLALTVLALTLATLFPAAEMTPRAEAAFPGRNGRIAIAILSPPFTSLPDAALGVGDRDIFTFAPGGGGIRQVTSGPAHDAQPEWSPDGRKIVFFRADPQYPGPSTSDIYVVNSDGTGLRNLTNTPAYAEHQPAWSPDGKRIVFSSDRSNPGVNLLSEHDLFITDLDGGNLAQLTSDAGHESHPEWSPDGRWIAFADAPGGISLIRPDGSGRRVVAGTGGWSPSWSPDGTKIAFGLFDGSNAWVVNVDGSGLRRLTAGDDSPAGNPTWSPDGKWIAFTSDRAGSWMLYKMRPDGSHVQGVTDIDLRGPNAVPDWGPRP